MNPLRPNSPPVRTLLGPGPSECAPEVLAAMSRPTLGHLDPLFLALMDEVRVGLREAYRTKNELAFPVSCTGTAGMETVLVNLLSPGCSWSAWPATSAHAWRRSDGASARR
jgi:alanine-glyoxylate transaminase/serine-glyoxylate transaminase/serine-pyruvate transaminase